MNVNKYMYISLGIQSYSRMMIGVSNHLLSIVLRFHYHSQEVIGFLGFIYIVYYNILLLIPNVPAMCLQNQWFQYIYDGTTTLGTWKNLRFLCETKESRSSSVVKKMTSPESSPFGAAQGRCFFNKK